MALQSKERETRVGWVVLQFLNAPPPKFVDLSRVSDKDPIHRISERFFLALLYNMYSIASTWCTYLSYLCYSNVNGVHSLCSIPRQQGS